MPSARSRSLRIGALLGTLSLVIGAIVPPARAADIEAGRKKAATCAACHGPDGNGTIPGTPSIAAMPPFYAHWQLIMFRDGRRKDAQMSPLAEKLSDADMADLTAFYAEQKAQQRPAQIDNAHVAAGRKIAEAQNCLQCHGPGLMGQQGAPRLAGQDAEYLRKRLRGFQTKTTSDLDGMMTMNAQSLSDEDIENLVHFMASIAPR
jgi:cytochrome c553